MFRRSRFSVRPNVGTAGRTAATPQEAPPANQDPSETSRDAGEGNSGPAVPDDKSVVTPEKNTASGEGNDQNGEGGSSSAALQRRKRFSVKPKVAPGRPAPLARAAKSPVKPVSEIAVEASGSDIKKPTTSSQPSLTAASPGLRSPRRRRPSEDVKQAKVQPKPTHIPPESNAPSAVPPAENSLKPTDSGKQLESASGSPVKEAPPRVPFLIPDREAIELSEKAKTLVSSKSKLSLSPSALSLSRLLNDPSDLQRLAKAQKLKELLREERHKEKKLKKAKMRLKEFTLDPTKMTMRDLLHYVPLSNPMTSSLENSTQEEETVIPASPGSTSPERAQQPEVVPKIMSPREDEVVPKIMSPREEEDEEANEEEDESLMVPQVKVAEDGSLIIDEESLTVEVQRAKGPNPVHDRDPIFERGSTTTYSSFRKGTCSKPWSNEETDMFFLAISMVGTDFSMICQLFPHRARAEIKNKFKKEERQNAWRIDKAFRERRKLDIEYFSKLLEKIMEVQKNRKKLKSLTEKPPKKRKAKGRKSAKKLSDVEEEDEEDENLPDLEDEEGGGKENELLCNEGEATASKPGKQRKRKTREDASTKEPSKKRSKKGGKSSEQDEPDTPQDTEAALPEEPQNSDNSVTGENADAKDTTVKPAKLSRGRAPKPLLPLGRKLRKKVPPPSTKAKESADESLTDANSKQVNEAAAKISANEENSSDDDEAPVAPPKPSRYGRIPKPTKPVSEPASSSPVQHSPSAAKPKAKCTPKRGRSSVPQSDQESKKPKLVTLRASQSDDSDEENGQQWEQEEGEEEQNPACSPSKDSTAPAFVPASLRSPQAKISMVEETMEELDMLANIPDVLGISQVVLCPDASCEEAHNETCDHQLDLLVDVIDFLSSEHTEVTEDESYNEAAHTLLTIGNLYSQDQAGTQAQIPETTSNGETSATSCLATGEQQADNGCNEQRTSSDTNPVPQFQSSTESLKTGLPQTVLDLEPPRTDCQCEPSFEQANQERGSISSQAEMTESKSISAAPGKSVTESQLEEGLNTDSAQSQKDGHQSAAFIGSSEEDLPVSQEAGSEVASSSQPRRSRMQKVKPNLPLTSRAARSKPQVMKTPIPKPVAELEPEPSSATPPENSTENIGLVSDLKPPLNLGATAEQSIAEEKNEDYATFGQVDSTSDGNSSGNKNISEHNFQLTSEQARTFSVSDSTSTNEKLMSDTTERGSNLGSPEVSRTETVEEGLDTDSVRGQDDGDRADAFVKAPATDLPVSQEAPGEVASPLQPRRSRMQKVKPNLPLTCRAARSKQEGKLTESTGPVSDLSASQDLSTSLTPADEKNTDDATLGQRDSGAAAGSSVDNFQPRSEQTGSVSESTTPTSLGTDLPVSQKAVRSESSKDMMAEVGDQSAGTTEISSQSSSTAVSVPSLESSINTEEQKTDVGFGLDSSSESSESSVAHRRRRSVKVKPKPNLTSVKASRSKLPPKGTSKTPDQQHMNTPLSVMGEQQSEHTSSAHSEPEPTEKDDKNRMSARSPMNTQPLDSVKAAAAEMETSLDCTGDKDASSALASTQVAEICSLLTAAVPEKGSGETSTGDKMSSNTEVEVKGGSEVDVSTGAAELKTQPPDSAEFSSVQILEEDSTKSKINAASTTTLDKKENRRQSFPPSDNEDRCQAAAQQTSETTEVSHTSDEKSQSARSTDESQLESSGSAFTSKARPARRGRLIKPKPNLGRSSQLLRVQQVQNEAQAQADCSAHSKDVGASVSHEAASERRPQKKPAEGAAEQDSLPEPHSGAAVVQLGQLNPPSHDAESSLGSLTQVPPAQSVPTSSAEGIQSHPCLPLFSDMMLEQVPSDPDEPFFILSLTEIPVPSSGEVEDGAAEPLSYLPVTDASIPQRSELPGEHVGAAAGDASASGVPVPTSTEESGEMSSINVNDSGRVQATHEDSIMKDSVDVQHARPTVQSPNTVSNNNDSESTSTKLRPRGTGRKAAKIQVKPSKARTKQGGKALVPNPIRTVEPNACDATANAGDEVIAEPQRESGDQAETAACAQGSSSKASTARARSRTSIAAPAKAASSSSKVKAPRGAGQRSSTAPRNVAPTQSPEDVPSSPQTQREAERSTAPAAGCSQSTEVSASRESDCVQSSSAEEEPTSVSQYFLSDIFTDIAEV